MARVNFFPLLPLALIACTTPKLAAETIGSLKSPATCSAVVLGDRVDCFPEGYQELNESNCNTRGCCWNQTVGDGDGIPICFYPLQFGYAISNVQQNSSGIEGDLHIFSPYQGPYGDNISPLKLRVSFLSESILRFKIFDPNNARYEVPIQVPQTDMYMEGENPQYTVEIAQAPAAFGLRIRRASSQQPVFDSISFGGLVFEDQFIQLSTKLASAVGYGLGEHVAPLLLNYNWNTLSMFARDQGTPSGYTNLYGVHPLLVTVEPSGNASGIFFFNSNAMDIVLQPTPGVTFR